MNWWHRVLMAIALVLLGWVIWEVYLEVTFDYTACHATEQYRDRHQNAWVQTIPGSCNINGVCTAGTTIYHPARDWTERLYQCPSDDGTFDKWRNERRT